MGGRTVFVDEEYSSRPNIALLIMVHDLIEGALEVVQDQDFVAWAKLMLKAEDPISFFSSLERGRENRNNFILRITERGLEAMSDQDRCADAVMSSAIDLELLYNGVLIGRQDRDSLVCSIQRAATTAFDSWSKCKKK